MAYLKSSEGYVYDNLNAPVGTKMVFNQTASPLGWTKVTSSNDVSLRLVSGTVGTGGTVAFETAFASQTPTISMSNAAHTITTAQMPAHSHTFHWSQYNYSDGPYGTSKRVGSAHSDSTSSTGSGQSHTHSNSSSSSAINLDVSYVDVIIATKA